MNRLVYFVVSLALTLGLIFGVRALAGFIFNAAPPEKPAVAIPEIVEKKPQATDAAPASGAEQPAAYPHAASRPAQVDLAYGDAAKGKKVFKKCKACHVADKEQNKVGPHLVGIINRPVAAVEGFKYSPAMREKAGELGSWTKENLAQYLASPKKFIPGNKMAFAGLRKPQDIADLLAYLESLAP